MGVEWFNREAFERLLWWMLAIAAIDVVADGSTELAEVPQRPAAGAARQIAACYEVVKALRQAEEQSGYQVAQLLEAIQPTG